MSSSDQDIEQVYLQTWARGRLYVSVITAAEVEQLNAQDTGTFILEVCA
jgi:hypothetical protein